MIIETCPKCGHDLVNLMLASNPPIPKKECWSCGWSWTGEPEKVVRVPFGGNQIDIINDDYTLNNYRNINRLDALNADYDLKHNTLEGFNQSACNNCPNNPKNGGSGICHCTLVAPQITC